GLEDLVIEAPVVLDRRRLIHRLDHRAGEFGRAGGHEHRSRVALGPVDRHGRLLFTAGILARGSRSAGPGVANEVEIARVHEEPGGLADHEHRIPPVDRVGQERQAAAQGEIPEVSRDDALALALGRNPLDEKARREEGLAEKADAEPELIRGHRRPLSVVREGWVVASERPGPTGEAYDARPNMARRTLYALRTSSGRRRPETRAKVFSASSVGTVLLLSPTSVRSRRGISSATETRERLLMEVDFSARSS